jgi:glycosyltransferase involved in cell wall biosynthesis
VRPGRIVILNDISDAKGGATALALLSALELRRRGFPVTFLTGDEGVNRELRAAGVELVGMGQQRLTSRSRISAFTSGLYNRRARAMVDGWIAAHDTADTVYHLHGWSQILSPSIFAALARVNDRLVYSAHDFFLACPNGSFSFLKSGAVCGFKPMSAGCIAADCDRRSYAQKLWRVARQALQRRHFAITDPAPILMIHAGMRSFFERSGVPGAALHTLPNPITPFATTRIVAEANRRALFVGRLEATKGPDLACAACRAAGVPLTMIGDGELAGELRDRYPEVEFLGRLPPAAIAGHAARARMLLMPSRYPEPYGLVAIEAAWSGLPVIVAETALLAPDIVAAGAGAAIDPRDTSAFAAAISALAHDDVIAARQSRAAFSRTRDLGLTTGAWVDGLIGHYAARLGG